MVTNFNLWYTIKVALNRISKHKFGKTSDTMSDLDFDFKSQNMIKGTFTLRYNKSLRGVIYVSKRENVTKAQ